MAGRRLSHADRHEQLLGEARAIVRDQGADALTLGRLAEAAGVSKPIAYEHFGDRAGLLIEMYRRSDAQQMVLLTEALAKAQPTLASVAQVVAEGYIVCCEANGAEGQAISAALRGDERMERVQQELVDAFIEVLVETLAPFSGRDEGELRLRCIGYNGAAEAVARSYLAGRTDRGTAISALADMMVRTVGA